VAAPKASHTLSGNSNVCTPAERSCTSDWPLCEWNCVWFHWWHSPQAISMIFCCDGMLEFVETDYNLDLVAGHKEAKEHLRQAARAIKNGRADVMPMGYLIGGPVGTGKTFMITCFSGEIGIPMVKLKNFRSQWQGATEGNLEKILTLLEAMTPVAVMIDEADAMLGNRDASGDSGVSQRVFGQIASFMSNSKHRGRIIFFLVTARPDLMPIDLKRQGRAEEHLALFYPSAREDREELLNVMMKRTGSCNLRRSYMNGLGRALAFVIIMICGAFFMSMENRLIKQRCQPWQSKSARTNPLSSTL
jgi:hypothetical protein